MQRSTTQLPRFLGALAGTFLFLASLAVVETAAAQEETSKPGRVVGRVLSDQGLPIVHAYVEIIGGAMPLGVNTGPDGRYTLPSLAADTITIRVRAIGYAPKVIRGIVVSSGGVTGQEIMLTAEAVELEEITVFATEETGSVAAALNEQRYAESIINTISEEQIQRSPDSDAAQAVQRVSGVTVQDDKFVAVRGLGERYTTTSLNGSKIPSPEPEKKMVPLDIFPANMLEGVTTSKTFTPEQSGDFAGANVNLKTREFPYGRKIAFSAEMGFNNTVTGQDFANAPRTGGEWLALTGSSRDLPAGLAGAGNLAGSSPADVNQFIASFRNAWWSNPSQGLGSGKFNGSIGGEDPVFGQLLGYLVAGTYKASQDVRADEERALATGGGAINEYSGSSFNNSVLWGGVANFSTRFGPDHRVKWDNTYNRSADNTSTLLSGVNEEFSGQGPLQFTRLSYIERSVWQTQLAGEHLVGGRHLLDWRGSLSGTSRDEPDRSDVIYLADTTGTEVVPTAWADIRQSATRTWSRLREDAGDVAGNFRYTLGDPVQPSSIKVGASYRNTSRDAPSSSYDIRNLNLSAQERQQQPERLFAEGNALAGRFTMLANALAGSYTANEAIGAGYAQAEIPLTSNLQLIGGARVEHWDLKVQSSDLFGRDTVSNPINTDVLPALALNWRVTDRQTVRLSASQTVSRPEYREVAAVSSVEILGDKVIIGNPDLGRALVQNYDVRWELYPRSGEVLSVGVFAKRFQDPIEQVLIATTGAAALSYVNAESAFNYGIELELRKGLDFITGGLRNWSFLINTTLMESQISLGTDSLSALTNPDRPMVGQAPYVVNTGVGYISGSGRWSGNLLFNVVGRRIVEAGQQPLPDAYEESRPMLDFALRGPITASTSFKIDFNNILDSPFEITQGDVTRAKYRTGRVFKFGISWDM